MVTPVELVDMLGAVTEPDVLPAVGYHMATLGEAKPSTSLFKLVGVENWQKFPFWVKGLPGTDETVTVINALALTQPLTELAT